MAPGILLGKISSNFKAPNRLLLAGKMFRLSKVVKNFHLYELDVLCLSLVGYILEFQGVIYALQKL